MNRQTTIILSLLAIVIALPFIFQRESATSNWNEGDPFLIIISPHNEAIRFEFASGFSRWHEEKFGSPVKIDWRNIGGTSEIARYLKSEITSSFRAWWKRQGKDVPSTGFDAITNRKFDPTREAYEGEDEDDLGLTQEMVNIFRSTDDNDSFSTSIDLFFGGGHYDHDRTFREGMTVSPWEGGIPEQLIRTENGIDLIPSEISGEVWRSGSLFGTAVSTFGICYNFDRLEELGIEQIPNQWSDLTDPRYFRQLGVADPTKSGSIAKAFELIIHQAIKQTVLAEGFTEEDIASFEALIADNKGIIPPSVPDIYQQTVEEGWKAGLRRVQLMGANARYFTDSASKVPLDVSMGNAAAGIAIDFYGRYQAQVSQTPDGEERMGFITPQGGSGVSCDPISLLRGAPHRETAIRFIEYVLSEEGQKLWTYTPGSPGGPELYALRRVPIHRAFYPSEDEALQKSHEAHVEHAADDLASDTINPYAIAETFIYYPRWTGRHFGVQRDIIRVMCMDSSKELKEAWKTILDAGGPDAQPEAMRLLSRLPDTPEELSWGNVTTVAKRFERLEYMRQWTKFFRDSYREAQNAVTEDRP